LSIGCWIEADLHLEMTRQGRRAVRAGLTPLSADVLDAEPQFGDGREKNHKTHADKLLGKK
jgi:hypothetical protein